MTQPIPHKYHTPTARVAVLLVILVTAPSLTAAAAAAEAPAVEVVDGVRYIHNGAEALAGGRTLRLEEIWRVNTEEEEELIGYITAVLAGPDETVWLVDSQLGQVLVYSADGDHLQTLSREGEGPGEVSSPRALIWLPGGGLGILDRKPGQFTHLDLDGLPLSSVHLKAVDGEPLGSAMMSGARCRGGIVAATGTQFRFDTGEPIQSRFLGMFDAEGHEVRRLLEAPSGFDFQARTYDEHKNWFVDRGAFDVDAAGRVHFAPARDRYRIDIHDTEGELVQVIEREYEPWRRTDEEKERMAGGATMSINGEIVKLRSTWAEFAPAIERLDITDDGRIWVLSGRGFQEEREGILRSYDLFDAKGRFTEVVHLAVEIDKDRDMLHHLDDGRWILLRNLVTDRNAGNGAEDEASAEEGEDEPLEIVCLRAATSGAADHAGE